MGVPTGGALDTTALQYANNLVGNALATPVLEITLSGPHVRCLEPGRVALVGGGFSLLLNGAQQTDNSAVSVNAGDELVIKSSSNGCRSYLAVSGEWQVKRWLGSASALRVKAGFYDHFRLRLSIGCAKHAD